MSQVHSKEHFLEVNSSKLTGKEKMAVIVMSLFPRAPCELSLLYEFLKGDL